MSKKPKNPVSDKQRFSRLSKVIRGRRAIRGGDWFLSTPYDVRPTERNAARFFVKSDRSGFRIVKNIPKEKKDE